jgi:hypothetical protein
MLHNSRSHSNAYQNLEEDISYFGMKNVKPVLELLANHDEKLVQFE